MLTKEIYYKYNIMMVKYMYKASMIEFVFKVIKNLVPPIFQNYYIFNARRVTRQNKELLISRVKTEQAKNIDLH